MSELSDAALRVAISQVGQTEKPLGSNWGEPVKTYLASVGINFPAAWCFAFDYWCFGQAAAELHVPNPLPKTGSVLHAWETADSVHKITSNPQAGDIFIMDLGGGLGHAGIVESVVPSILHTIDGNTNNGGSREGIEVERKSRPPVHPIIGYLRY
jgi:hypothetical protein